MTRERLLRVTYFLSMGLAALLLMEQASAQSLTVVNNGGAAADAMRAVYFEPFTAQTGTQVVGDNFNQELGKVRAQIETGNLIWDVADMTAINEATGCQEGLFEKIDWSQYLDPKDFEGVGGFGKCGVPNTVATGALVYDGDKYQDDMAPKSWADFWNVEKWPGKRGLLYRAEQTLEVALMADGVPPGEVMRVLAAPGGVDRAFQKLEELKPHIHWWKSGAESMQLILSGEVAMTYGWNGRVAVANASTDRNLKIVFEAGHVSGCQYFTIMKDTPNKDLAIKFIQFALSPEAQAEYAHLIHYAPANEEAYAVLTTEEKATLPGENLHSAFIQGGDLYVNFWLENGDSLLRRFIQFAAQ